MVSNDNKLIKRLQEGKIKTIIFDFDGTLLDIKNPLESAVKEVLVHYKISVDLELTIKEIGALLESIQGHPISKILLQSYEIFKYITALERIPFLKKLRVALKIFSKYQSYSEEAALFPITKELLKVLSESHDLFILSHNKTENIEKHLEKNDIGNLFKGIYGSDNLPELKPNPEAFDPILEFYKSPKGEEFLMIGDMPTDIEAGQEAGFWTIGVASGISKKDILAEFKPDLLIESLSEFLAIVKTENTISNVNKSLKIKS